MSKRVQPDSGFFDASEIIDLTDDNWEQYLDIDMDDFPEPFGDPQLEEVLAAEDEDWFEKYYDNQYADFMNYHNQQTEYEKNMV